ncbi:YbaB/EbfC family nucleoid-associated protein [Leeuwenhoekiella sp. NPDC079379]|uniref:YbaB/EbfC family nucleoid-associated protein n=1 Tax=Leeuwenhoekiella sp. NPDC079379 TaxID=3364122 RepID=UPI0037C5B054
MFGDMMGMMGKIKEAQQKAEDTKKRLETVYIDEKSSDNLIEVSVSVAGAVKKIEINDELLSNKEQLEDYLILTLNKALARAKSSYDQELAAVAKEGMPDIPGLDMFK